MKYSDHVSTRATPQREPVPGRSDQVPNSEGGFVFPVDDWVRLDRFLILGSEGGTFYIGERELTQENAKALFRLVASDGQAVVAKIVEVSESGRAHKNDAALFALAIAAKHGDGYTRTAAYEALPRVARIGTHLFQFAEFLQAFGGWGRATKRAFAKWYNGKEPDRLAYQLLKYRQREGWSHRDILRLAHPLPKDAAHKALFDVTAHPDKLTPAVLGELPRIYSGYFATQNDDALDSIGSRADLAREFGLSREMLPTEWLKDVDVNKALLETMPLMATIRNLGRLTANGTIKPLSDEVKLVTERLTNDEVIRKSRIHPMHYLLAVKNYAAGEGFRGSLSWDVNSKVITALNDGFYKAFVNVEPTGKAFLLGVDVSSSMTWAMTGSNISAAEAAGAMALVIAKTEENHFIHGFTSAGSGGYRGRSVDGFVNLGIGPEDGLHSAMAKVQLSNFGGTDCAIPMLYASANELFIDCFVVLTDNETWAGNIQPFQALKGYREKINPTAKLVVVGMTSSGFTIADPNDAGMIDVVGFDAAVPQFIADFAK